jgi:hypothetical protein
MTTYSLIDAGARTRRLPNRGPDGERRLRLLPSGDGWSLVGGNGTLVFSALGRSGRRRCLEFAAAAGVLAIAG